MAFVSVYVTCPSETVAERIARDLLEQRLVACANIVPGVRSLYRWEGRVEDAREVVMFLKTRRALVPRIEAAVRVLHPDKTPCIVAFDLAGGSADYLAWVAEETSPHPSST